MRQNQQDFMLEWIREPRESELLKMMPRFLTGPAGWMAVAFTEKKTVRKHPFHKGRARVWF